MIKKIDTIAGRVWKVLAYILGALMFALVVIVFWQVVCRFVLRSSSGWTSEISTLIFVWATYLGAALAIRSGSQISMTLIVGKVGRPVKQIIQIIAAIICEIFYGVFTAAGVAAVIKFSATTTASLRIPMPWAYGAFVVSGIIMLVFGIGEIGSPIIALIRKEDKITEEKEEN